MKMNRRLLVVVVVVVHPTHSLSLPCYIVIFLDNFVFCLFKTDTVSNNLNLYNKKHDTRHSSDQPRSDQVRSLVGLRNGLDVFGNDVKFLVQSIQVPAERRINEWVNEDSYFSGSRWRRSELNNKPHLFSATGIRSRLSDKDNANRSVVQIDSDMAADFSPLIPRPDTC